MLSAPSFDALLEHYVFRVADALIDQVDTNTQTRLIKFIYELNPDAPTDNSPNTAATACVPHTTLADVEVSVPEAVDNQPVNTIGSSLDLDQTKRTYQQQLKQLDDLAHKVEQVQANLASTQARLMACIHQNNMLMARFRKYTLP